MLKIASSLTDAQERIVYRTIGCGLKFEAEKRVEVQYKQWKIGGQKVDVIVEGLVLVELKAVPKLKAIHKAQTISYLKTVKLPVGLLFNFNSVVLKNGMKRIALSEPAGRKDH